MKTLNLVLKHKWYDMIDRYHYFNEEERGEQ